MIGGKEKVKVLIALRDNIILRGGIHINQGERVLDFINDIRESFIAVTEVEVFHPSRLNPLVLPRRATDKKKTLVVIKSAILWIEEI